MAATGRPSMVSGAVTAMICSPVEGSFPVQGVVLGFSGSKAPAMSGVPGELYAASPKVEKRMAPLEPKNCISTSSFPSKLLLT